MTEAGDPVRLGEMLATTATKLGLGHAAEMGALWSRWASVVGPAIAGHVEPTSLRDHVLRLRADSPTWATEIGYLREDIRRSANEALGQEVISEVRVWTGPGRVSGAHARDPSTRYRSRREEVPEDRAVALQRALTALRASRAKAGQGGSVWGAEGGKNPS